MWFKGLVHAIIIAPRIPFLGLILLYQKTVSPDHGLIKDMFPNGYCKFYPSCSQYGYEVIKKKGVILGLPLTLWRILRCNPWSKGGMDPVK